MPEPDSTSGSQAPRRSGFWTFWTTLPGILTGIAAVITASVGLITMLNRSGRERTVAPSDRAASTQSAAVSQPVPTPSAQPQGVLTQGQITMKSPDRVDLETGLAPTGGADGGDFYLYCSGVNCLLNPMGSLVSLTDGPGGRRPVPRPSSRGAKASSAFRD